MSAPTIVGTRIRTPFVIPRRKSHRHNWQPTEYFADGRLIKAHVCTDHSKPVLEPYEVVTVTEGLEAL